jgi:hypothetical protein
LDKDRQIRMLIPPFFLVASVLWAAYLSGSLSPFLRTGERGSDVDSLKLVLSVFGVVGVSTLPIGYAISTLTIAAMRVWPVRFLFPHRNYEMPISTEALGRVWQVLRVSRIPRLDFFASTAFDHALLEPKIHEWLIRRWNSFNVSTSSITALIVSLPLSCALHIPVLKWGMWRWWSLVLFLVAILVWRSAESWREVKGMFDLAVGAGRLVRPEMDGVARPSSED